MAGNGGRRNRRKREQTANHSKQRQRQRYSARSTDLAVVGNLYMRRFLLGWKQEGWEQRLQAYIVNYADDFVILCRPGFSTKMRRTSRRCTSTWSCGFSFS